MLPLKHSPPPSGEKALQKGFFWHIPFPFPFQSGREICRATKREKHLYSTLGTSRALHGTTTPGPDPSYEAAAASWNTNSPPGFWSTNLGLISPVLRQQQEPRKTQ